jgi:hypothetical protein
MGWKARKDWPTFIYIYFDKRDKEVFEIVIVIILKNILK